MKSLSLKPVREQVIVITGASSGIGLATARMAAKKGARLVLASRGEDALAKVEKEINRHGGTAIHVVADVAKAQDVERIAQAAVERFGGFDSWINDAGIGIWGKLEDISDEDHRQLFETNFWGIVNGSKIAARHLKHKGGAIINLGSIASDIGFPLQAMYAASKHAIKGYTDGLRMELEMEEAPVSVTLIKPAAIATWFGRNARNYLDVEPQLPAPVYFAEDVARAIIHATAHPVRDVYIGGGGRLLVAFNKIAPRLFDYLSETTLVKAEITKRAARARRNNLYKSASQGSIRPGHDDEDNIQGFALPALYTRVVTHPIMALAVVAAAVGVTAAVANALSNQNVEQKMGERVRRLRRFVPDDKVTPRLRRAKRKLHELYK